MISNTFAPNVTLTSKAESSGEATQTISGMVVSTGSATVAGQTVMLVDNGETLTTAVPVLTDENGNFLAQAVLSNPGTNSIIASVADSDGDVGTSAAVVDTPEATPTITGTTGDQMTSKERHRRSLK